MLFNATQPEELRVALVDGQRLFDLDIESAQRTQKKANIYKARITRIEPSLEAAFVDYGSERHGFLPLKEISKEYFKSKPESGQRYNIKDLLSEGQEIVVQVEKEERGNKGAALTTFISLAGRYLVLMPNNPRAGGVSRRIEGDSRTELKDNLQALSIPKHMGLIARTAGVGKSQEELQQDLDYLLGLWKAVDTAQAEKSAPFLIYQESNIIIRAIRDYLRADITEIIIDEEGTHKEAYEFMQRVMPQHLHKVKLYKDNTPLFSRYQIEMQIETAFQREVSLPSGGAIVIDHTEALVSIDINSARATKGSDIEETALHTNLEAADEIARQLRLRDLGGLVVIDFIDMNPIKNQRAVENRLKEALKMDRARVQVGRISRFGLLEMSRQRLRPSLGESSQITCPRCDGQGTIRGIESLALSMLRIFEEHAMKKNTAKIIAHAPIDVATFILNEKREVIESVEKRYKINIVLIPNTSLVTPHYRIDRIRTDQLDDEELLLNSFEMNNPLEEKEPESAPIITSEEPMVKSVLPVKTNPISQPFNVVKKIWGSIFSKANEISEETIDNNKKRSRNQQENSDRPRSSGSQNRNQRRQGQTDRRPDKRTDKRSDGRKQNNRPNRNDNADDKRKQTRPVRGEGTNENRKKQARNKDNRSSRQQKDNKTNRNVAQNTVTEKPELIDGGSSSATYAKQFAENRKKQMSTSSDDADNKNTQGTETKPLKQENVSKVVESTAEKATSTTQEGNKASSENQDKQNTTHIAKSVQDNVETVSNQTTGEKQNDTNAESNVLDDESENKRPLRGPGARRSSRKSVTKKSSGTVKKKASRKKAVATKDTVVDDTVETQSKDEQVVISPQKEPDSVVNSEENTVTKPTKKKATRKKASTKKARKKTAAKAKKTDVKQSENESVESKTVSEDSAVSVEGKSTEKVIKDEKASATKPPTESSNTSSDSKAETETKPTTVKKRSRRRSRTETTSNRFSGASSSMAAMTDKRNSRGRSKTKTSSENS